MWVRTVLWWLQLGLLGASDWRLPFISVFSIPLPPSSPQTSQGCFLMSRENSIQQTYIQQALNGPLLFVPFCAWCWSRRASQDTVRLSRKLEAEASGKPLGRVAAS